MRPLGLSKTLPQRGRKRIRRSHDSKQLKNSPYFRADVGEYRVIYEIENDTMLLLILIGKRNDDDIYKKLSMK